MKPEDIGLFHIDELNLDNETKAKVEDSLFEATLSIFKSQEAMEEILKQQEDNELLKEALQQLEEVDRTIMSFIVPREVN